MKHRALFVATHGTAITRCAFPWAWTIMDEQGFNNPHILSLLNKKSIDMLVSTTCKLGGMKSGTWKPGTSVPL